MSDRCSLLTKDVFMAKQNCLVELGLSEPARLLCGEEYLDSHVLSTPFALPHLAVSSFTNTLYQVYLLGNCSLNLK